MSIIVKGMKMPSNCAHCICASEDSRYCAAANEYIPMLGKPKWCPLVEVPTPHGRLVDADELWNELGIIYEHCNGRVRWNDAVMEIKNAPTIVEAEDGT